MAPGKIVELVHQMADGLLLSEHTAIEIQLMVEKDDHLGSNLIIVNRQVKRKRKVVDTVALVDYVEVI